MSRSRKVAVIASSRRHKKAAQIKMGREAQKNKAPRGAF
jgi:hypothetical protein